MDRLHPHAHPSSSSTRSLSSSAFRPWHPHTVNTTNINTNASANANPPRSSSPQTAAATATTSAAEAAASPTAAATTTTDGTSEAATAAVATTTATTTSLATTRSHAQSSAITRRRGRPCVLNEATVDIESKYRAVNPAFTTHQAIRRCLTKPSEPVHNHQWDNAQHDYILYVHDELKDDREPTTYVVLNLLGTGTFGQVVECQRNPGGDIVAVKVIKNQPAYFNQAWVEISILKMLHQNNPPGRTTHIVRLDSHFIFRDHLCLVFERLDINLYELLKANMYKGLEMDLLRTFTSQLLEALVVLVRSEVIHCDLKPENILLKSPHPPQLKLIDFGSACQLNYPVYSYVQSRFYRSPEVLLGYPKYNSQIDMWSLGCVAAELFLGIPLFPGHDEMNMVCRIVEMLGDIPDRFLHQCRNTDKFFNRTRMHAYPGIAFQLKSIAQYERENNTTLGFWKRFFNRKSLRDVILNYPRSVSTQHQATVSSSTTSSSSSAPSASSPQPTLPLSTSSSGLQQQHSATQPPRLHETGAHPNNATTSASGRTPSSTQPPISHDEKRMRECFVDFLLGILRVDPSERWTPSEAAQHPFLRAEPLPGGQPWVPPSRPRRIARMTTTAPDAAATMYSSSAPNFNPTQVAPHGVGVPPRQFVPFPYPNPQSMNPALHDAHVSVAIPTSDLHVSSSDGHLQPSFAPGSYVPPSVMPSPFMYSASLSTSFNPIANAISNPNVSTSTTNPQSLHPGSYDGRSAYLPHEHAASFHQNKYLRQHLLNHNTPSDYASSLGNSGGLGPAPGRNNGGSGVGQGLHGSASRESLTGTLHPSASRESLGGADMTDDACIFPLVPDDETALSNNPVSGATGSVRHAESLPSSPYMTPSLGPTSAAPPAAGYTASQPPIPIPPPHPFAALSQQTQQPSLPPPPITSGQVPVSASLPPARPWMPPHSASGFPVPSGVGFPPGSWSGSWTGGIPPPALHGHNYSHSHGQRPPGMPLPSTSGVAYAGSAPGASDANPTFSAGAHATANKFASGNNNNNPIMAGGSSGVPTQLASLPPFAPPSSSAANHAGIPAAAAVAGQESNDSIAAGQGRPLHRPGNSVYAYRNIRQQHQHHQHIHSRAFRPARRSAPGLASSAVLTPFNVGNANTNRTSAAGTPNYRAGAAALNGDSMSAALDHNVNINNLNRSYAVDHQQDVAADQSADDRDNAGEPDNDTPATPMSIT